MAFYLITKYIFVNECFFFHLKLSYFHLLQGWPGYVPGVYTHLTLHWAELFSVKKTFLSKVFFYATLFSIIIIFITLLKYWVSLNFNMRLMKHCKFEKKNTHFIFS